MVAQIREVLTAQKIDKLVPSKIKGWYQKDGSKSKEVKLGNITYSLCERSFVCKKKSVKILLFDYADASVMYNQTMQRWRRMEPVESDSIILRVAESPEFSGWESYTSKNSNSQIVLGVHERFLLTLTGERMELVELKNFLQHFDFSKFPK